MGEKLYEATKVNNVGDKRTEELTEKQVSEMMLSAGFSQMLKRIKVGETLYYNEIKVEFKRIK